MSVNEANRTQSRLEAAVRANKLAAYTLHITANEKIFLPKYRSALTDKIISDAVDIYRYTKRANDIRVTKSEHWQKRNEYQRAAVEYCNDLIALISLAKPVFHLTSKRIEYWIGMTIETREIIKAWNDKDRDRYKGV